MAHASSSLFLDILPAHQEGNHYVLDRFCEQHGGRLKSALTKARHGADGQKHLLFKAIVFIYVQILAAELDVDLLTTLPVVVLLKWALKSVICDNAY